MLCTKIFLLTNTIYIPTIRLLNLGLNIIISNNDIAYYVNIAMILEFFSGMRLA